MDCSAKYTGRKIKECPWIFTAPCESSYSGSLQTSPCLFVLYHHLLKITIRLLVDKEEEEPSKATGENLGIMIGATCEVLWRMETTKEAVDNRGDIGDVVENVGDVGDMRLLSLPFLLTLEPEYSPRRHWQA